MLCLNGFTFSELFHADGLNRLDQAFLGYVKEQNPDFYTKLLVYRTESQPLTSLETSELLISCASILEDFLASLFQIEEAVGISKAKTTSQNPISTFKKYFVLRRAKKELSKASALPSFTILNEWLITELKKAPLKAADQELSIALLATHYLATP